MLTLEHVCKEYTKGREPVPVLQDICMTVNQGDYLAIMGPSGSGKTTLMNLLGCLDVPSEGTYILDGQDVGSLSDEALARVRNRLIGFVFQNFNLMPKMTALDNVMLPLLYAGVPLRTRRRQAEEALRLLGLEDRMHFYPNQLSGGQCQRVAIARAIVGKPKLILADEPTGALDTASGEQIMQTFRTLNERGITIIMITHEKHIADHADRIAHILDGRLVEPEPVQAVKGGAFAK
ncbi:MAG: ABC transporter ATP-binding protein [Oscillospiraceae bacterium]|nr:ABC transporter ATP-binding protein [Oscillospiraceae bacterium]